MSKPSPSSPPRFLGCFSARPSGRSRDTRSPMRPAIRPHSVSAEPSGSRPALVRCSAVSTRLEFLRAGAEAGSGRGERQQRQGGASSGGGGGRANGAQAAWRSRDRLRLSCARGLAGPIGQPARLVARLVAVRDLGRPAAARAAASGRERHPGASSSRARAWRAGDEHDPAPPAGHSPQLAPCTRNATYTAPRESSDHSRSVVILFQAGKRLSAAATVPPAAHGGWTGSRSLPHVWETCAPPRSAHTCGAAAPAWRAVAARASVQGSLAGWL